MKTLQLLGNLIPALLLAFAYYLFADIDPDLPSYARGSLAMLWFGLAIFAMTFVFIFIIPSSFILLKAENRQYFLFKSKGWLFVLVLNWVFIALYCLCFLTLLLTS